MSYNFDTHITLTLHVRRYITRIDTRLILLTSKTCMESSCNDHEHLAACNSRVISTRAPAWRHSPARERPPDEAAVRPIP